MRFADKVDLKTAPWLRFWRFWPDMLLIIVALWPRWWRLGHFLTPDEILFLDHARAFGRGLVQGQWLDTLGIGYPGVTVALTASPAVALAQTELGGYLAGRIAIVGLTALLLWAVYRLSRELFGHWPAFWATLILALDPFLLGYSRLLHIAAPLALLMTLTALAWLLWLQRGGWAWLSVTALLTGLALLTKSTALTLGPMVFLATLVWGLWATPRFDMRRWGQILAAAVAVAGGASVVFVALWPAMWLDPLGAVQLTFGKLLTDQAAGTGNLGMFWRGQFVEDPGPFFYPVTLLLKLSPWVMVGLVINVALVLRPVWFGLKNSENAENAESRRRWQGLSLYLWTAALVYLLVMTLADKKSVRYVLPLIPFFALLTGLALTQASLALKPRWSAWLKRPRWAGAMVGLILLAFAWVYQPHYFSYYNPLVLGWRWAPQMILVGWGEGLSEPAGYLNQVTETPQDLRVAAWYDWLFAPYFQGETLPLSGENAITADYSVFYINQVQRGIPDPNLIRYVQRRTPSYTVRLNGVDYAWVYPAVSRPAELPASATPVNVVLGEQVELVGYDIGPIQPISPAELETGLVVTLYWRALQAELPPYFVYVRAIEGTATIRARSDSPPALNFWPTPRWRIGELVEDAHLLTRPADTAPGTYRLEVGLYSPETGEVLAPAGGERGAGGGLLLGEFYLP